MPDISPNPLLEIKRLEVQKQSQLVNLSKYELRLMEIEDEKNRMEHNILTVSSAIADIDSHIKSMKETNNG